MLSNFWDVIWLFVWGFLLISYLIILFQIITDLFRDTELGGFWKALWIIALLAVPMLTALAYIVTRGAGMARRQNADTRRARDEADNYIREVAGRSPAKEIADAQALLSAGTITETEFTRLKAKALS